MQGCESLLRRYATMLLSTAQVYNLVSQVDVGAGRDKRGDEHIVFRQCGHEKRRTSHLYNLTLRLRFEWRSHRILLIDIDIRFDENAGGVIVLGRHGRHER